MICFVGEFEWVFDFSLIIIFVHLDGVVLNTLIE